MAYTFGLAGIYVADVLHSGLMPDESEMVKIGEVLENTASITQEEASFTDFKEQGNSTPKKRIKTEGAINFAFQIMNADPVLLAEYIGGEVINGAWNYMGKSADVEKALYIKPEEGLSYRLPKASISATIGGELNNENLVTVTFTVTPLSPGDDLPSLISEVVGSSSNITYYAGSAATLPTTSAAAKTALTAMQVSASNGVFTFGTGSTNKNFLIAIPTDRTLRSIVNQTTTEPLTSEFELDSALGFTEGDVTYKVYKMTIAVAFSSDNIIKVSA